MTISTPVFFSIWSVAFLAWFPLTYQYRSKWRSQIQEFGSEIRSYNAKVGYDQSVGRDALASDLINPFRNECIQDFANNNGLSPEEYTNEVEQVLENPQDLFWSFLLHLLTFIILLYGLLFFAPLTTDRPMVYLTVLYFTLTVDIALYLYQ